MGNLTSKNLSKTNLTYETQEKKSKQEGFCSHLNYLPYFRFQGEINIRITHVSKMDTLILYAMGGGHSGRAHTPY